MKNQTAFFATSWSGVIVSVCKNVKNCVQVRCVWSRDYHTIGGVYIMPVPDGFVWEN